MAKRGNLNFEKLYQTDGPYTNPNGMVAQNPNGTIINGNGGDGQQYSWPPRADGEKWNTNPVPQPPDPFNFGPFPAKIK